MHPNPTTEPGAARRPAGTGPGAAGQAAWARGLVKIHGQGPGAVRALDGVTVAFDAGRFTAIMGPSGSGKSTLLHCLAGLDSPTGGEVVVAGTDLTRLSAHQRTLLRRDRLGFVFQSFNLLPMLTAEENITLPARLAGRRVDRERLGALVRALGLADRLGHHPGQLSGGQQQRVAVARALLPNPEIVFADEPTGSLDTRAGATVLRFLRDAVDTERQTVVMVTHNPVAAAHADRVLFLRDGRVVDELPAPTAQAVLDRLRRMEG